MPENEQDICKHMLKDRSRKARAYCSLGFGCISEGEPAPSGWVPSSRNIPLCGPAEDYLQGSGYYLATRRSTEGFIAFNEVLKSVADRQSIGCDSYEKKFYSGLFVARIKRRISRGIVDAKSSDPIAPQDAVTLHNTAFKASLPNEKGLPGQPTEVAIEGTCTLPERDGLFGTILRGEMTIRDLRANTTITGIDELEDLDLLNNRLLENLSAQTGISNKQGDKSISDSVMPPLRKRGFYGSMRNIQVTVISDSLQAETLAAQDLFAYAARFSLYSTGRGEIGESLAVVKIHVKKNKKPYLYLSVRNLMGEEGLIELEDLLLRSTINWEEAQREALCHVVSGGLPSLGKRR